MMLFHRGCQGEDEENCYWKTVLFFNDYDTTGGSQWRIKTQPTHGQVDLLKIPMTAVRGVSKLDLRAVVQTLVIAIRRSVPAPP